MLGLIGLLLVIWLVLIIVGATVKGLLWLLVVGAILFAATVVYGWIKREAFGKGPN